MGNRREDFIRNIKVNEEELKISRIDQIKATHEKNLKRNKTILGVAIGTIAAGAVFIGAIKSVNDNSKIIRNPKTAMEQGYTLDDMDIDEQTLEEIQEVNAQLQNFGDIPNAELPEFIDRVQKLQFNVLKTKISNELNEPVKNIKIHYSTKADDPNRIAVGEKIYLEKTSIIDSDKNAISKNINEYINSTKEIYKLNEKNIASEDIDREDIEKKCEEALKNVDIITATDFEIDKNGKLVAQKLRVTEKEENKEELASIEDEER